MSERQIRSLIRRVCADLDRRARKVAIPAALGVGLAVGAVACSDDDTKTDANPPADVGGPEAAYGVPFDSAAADGPGTDAEVDHGPQVDYMAPDGG